MSGYDTAKQLPKWAIELVKVGSSRWESDYAAAIEATGMYRHDRANFAGALIEEIERLRAIVDELRRLACDLCSDDCERNFDGYHRFVWEDGTTGSELCSAWTDTEAATAAGGEE